MPAIAPSERTSPGAVFWPLEPGVAIELVTDGLADIAVLVRTGAVVVEAIGVEPKV